jgi:hypothetical protein
MNEEKEYELPTGPMVNLAFGWKTAFAAPSLVDIEPVSLMPPLAA